MFPELAPQVAAAVLIAVVLLNIIFSVSVGYGILSRDKA